MYFLEQNNYRIRREDKTLQYKNKKNLYKIVFIAILLGFIISLVGCNWLSWGILNIFDPQAQIRLLDMKYTDKDKTLIDIEIASLNEVEFIGSGLKFEYYNGSTRVDSLDRTVGANFYIAPSASPGQIGESTKIENILLYSGLVLSYAKSNSAFSTLNCNIYLLGEDGSGHNQNVKIAIGIPALGIDDESPIAKINTTPSPATGPPPLTVTFDATESSDNRDIASYSWDFGDGNSDTGPVTINTYSKAGTYAVQLTVTDYFGNEAYDSTTVQVGAGEVGAQITTTPSPAEGFVPLTVAFDASGSTVQTTPATYKWDLDGDGVFDDATGIIVVKEYTLIGTYLVGLQITDSTTPTPNVYYDFVTVTANKAP